MDLKIYLHAVYKETAGVKMQDEIVWLAQQQLVDLYQSSKLNVIEHIFEEEELDGKAVVRKSRTTASDGKILFLKLYKINCIIQLMDILRPR